MIEAKPLMEITRDALRVLFKEIGVVNTVRFVNQFTIGYGDYTEEREKLMGGFTLEYIVSEVKRPRFMLFYTLLGIKEEYIDLLWGAGVNTISILAEYNPEDLYKKLAEINESKKRVRRLPQKSWVADWVKQARQLSHIL